LKKDEKPEHPHSLDWDQKLKAQGCNMNGAKRKRAVTPSQVTQYKPNKKQKVQSPEPKSESSCSNSEEEEDDDISEPIGTLTNSQDSTLSHHLDHCEACKDMNLLFKDVDSARDMMNLKLNEKFCESSVALYPRGMCVNGFVYHFGTPFCKALEKHGYSVHNIPTEYKGRDSGSVTHGLVDTDNSVEILELSEGQKVMVKDYHDQSAQGEKSDEASGHNQDQPQ